MGNTSITETANKKGLGEDEDRDLSSPHSLLPSCQFHEMYHDGHVPGRINLAILAPLHDNNNK